MSTAVDLQVLPSGEQAIERLTERVDAPAVHALASMLAQTMRYGTPLAQALRVSAEQMRREELVALEEKANKLPALMTAPMIALILPTLFLLVGGPAALNIMDTIM